MGSCSSLIIAPPDSASMDKSEHVVARFHRSADSGVANGKSFGHIEEPNRFLLFPHYRTSRFRLDGYGRRSAVAVKNTLAA